MTSTCLLFGESQTFVGVLLTLIVLCLFYNSKKKKETDEEKEGEEHTSNFIRNLLFHFKNDTAFGLSKKIKGLTDRHLSIPNLYDFNFKRYNDILDKLGNNDDEPYRNSLLVIYNKISSLPHVLVADMEGWKEKVNNCLKNLHNVREYELISYYTFLFALFFMFIDGFFAAYSCQYLTTLLYSFIVGSCGYCFILWRYFWIQSSCKYVTTELIEKAKKTRYKKLWKAGIYFTGLFLWRILCLFVIPVFGICIGATFQNSFIGLLVSCSITIIAFILGGKSLFDVIKYKENYNRLFIFSHFIYLLISAFLTAFLLEETTFIHTFLEYVNINNTIESQFHFTDLKIAGEATLIFIFFNSIILPLFLPYLRVQYYMIGFNYHLTREYIIGILQSDKLFKEYKVITSTIEQRYKIGIESAKEDGVNIEKYRIATLLVQKQIDYQIIQEVTGLSSEQINGIKK